MNDESRDIESLLVAGCRAISMEITRAEIDGVVGYVRLLRKWNQRINLVGTRDLQMLVQQHIVDALAVTRFVVDEPSRLIDVGSGAGLPGALIAVLRPKVQVTALEPVHKKQAFIVAVRRELSLANLRPLAQRMEAHRDAPGFARYDVAVSRATFALPEWLTRARTLVGEGGVILGMEGRVQHQLPADAQRHGYKLGDRDRAIVVLPVARV